MHSHPHNTHSPPTPTPTSASIPLDSLAFGTKRAYTDKCGIVVTRHSHELPPAPGPSRPASQPHNPARALAGALISLLQCLPHVTPLPRADTHSPLSPASRPSSMSAHQIQVTASWSSVAAKSRTATGPAGMPRQNVLTHLDMPHSSSNPAGARGVGCFQPDFQDWPAGLLCLDHPACLPCPASPAIGIEFGAVAISVQALSPTVVARMTPQCTGYPAAPTVVDRGLNYPLAPYAMVCVHIVYVSQGAVLWHTRVRTPTAAAGLWMRGHKTTL